MLRKVDKSTQTFNTVDSEKTLRQREANTHSVTSKRHTTFHQASISFIFWWIIDIIAGMTMKFSYTVKGLKQHMQIS